MKKIFMAMVCLMTTVMISSCGNIEEDGNAAIEKFGKWRNECVESHVESSIEDIEREFKAAQMEKRKMDLKSDSISYEAIESDIKQIFSKTLDPLFDKYGDKKVIEWLEKKFGEETYHNVKISSKQELYDKIILSIKLDYAKRYKDELELKFLELKSEMISKKYGY